MSETPIIDALRVFAEGALGLAAALEGTMPPLADRGDLEAALAAPEPQYLDDGSCCSYGNGRPLGVRAMDRRRKAGRRAKDRGYDYEHWCKRVREVRVKIGVGARGLGDLLGVTPSGVQNWETGVCFAKGETRAHLERVSAHLCGATHASWRKPKCD